MDIEQSTKQYYSHWLGVSPGDFGKPGILFVPSPERDKRQKGYSRQFDVYAWIMHGQLIVSYGRQAADKIDLLKKRIASVMDGGTVSGLLRGIYSAVPQQGMKFIFRQQPKPGVMSHQMRRQDFGLYKTFFAACNPSCAGVEWLEDYYDGMAESGLCFGEIVDGELACMNDLPDMPYIETNVQEIGINTLQKYRGKGCAKRVCSTCIKAMLDKGICPQWSTNAGNIASERLAYSVGFEKLAEYITISL